MSTVTKCTCGHEISQHTYSEDFTGCDVSGCNCMLDLGELIDKYQIEVTDRTEQGLKDTEKINDLLGELVLVERNYDALQTPMPCGHLARYAVNDKEGTQYCALCDRNAQMIALETVADVLNKTVTCMQLLREVDDRVPGLLFDHYDINSISLGVRINNAIIELDEANNQ